MKANELRINNLVKDRGNKILRIDWIEQDEVCQKNFIDENFEVHPFTEYFEYLKPIPLTEEWLLKFGFKYNEQLREYFKYTFELESYDNNYFIFIINNYGDELTIKHVHQLQNIYFALTGNELTL